jgi:hemoglobin
MTAADTPHSEDRPAGGEDPTAPFHLLGGEPGVRELVDRFYDLMAIDERFVHIRALHPNTLDDSRDKLFWFLCGWLGGPPHYEARFGHPRLRARHLPFPIASRERDEWLLCMAQAMSDRGVVSPLFERLLQAFHGTADWMRNRPDV